MSQERKRLHLHLVSDASGETVNSVARASISQFEEVHAVEHLWNLVRTPRQLEVVLEGIRRNPGVVMYTLVDEPLRGQLQEVCRELKVPCVSILDPIITSLAGYLGLESKRQPGRQHVLNAAYFMRMDAMDFALAHDDGMNTEELHEAHVVLVGVSRTSKTPTCLYLANRGIKAANVPLVPGRALPVQLDQLTKVLVVGLTKDPYQLLEVRRTRVRLWNQGGDMNYVDPDKVSEEVLEARRLFSRRGWPVIDVSRRSIEESAAEILMLLAKRQNLNEWIDEI